MIYKSTIITFTAPHNMTDMIMVSGNATADIKMFYRISDTMS
jgi:hypothetical protein